MSGALLGPGGEFDVIREILAGAAEAPHLVEVGPGDDAAVLTHPGRIISTDMTVEGVHHLREWLSPEEVGYRATMAALSDLAAMGAEPRAVLVSLAASSQDAGSGYLARVGRGTRAAADAVGAVLAGGDITRSPGPVVVDVVVVGDTEAPVLRSGACPGDGIWVTGELGGAAAAVRLWGQGEPVPAGLRDRFARPVPRLRAMAWLRATGLLTAGMDLSDGLLQDAGHLAAASGVRMSIDAERVPVSAEAREALGKDEALWAALAGGEDYELVVTARQGLEEHAEAFARETGVALTRVGIVEDGEGARVVGPDGSPLSPPSAGFDHFPALGRGDA